MTEDNRKLFTFEFIALNCIIAVAFCNIAVFYSFFHYLGSIGIPPAMRGFLTGLEPMTAFVLRIFVIPLIGVKDTLRLILVSLMMVIAVSLAYPFALTVSSLMALRIFHGAAFVLLTSALIALIVMFIPREKSGQGFGIISVATMIPYAVVPPVTETLLPHVRNESSIYAGFSLLALLAIVLMVRMRTRIENALGDMDASLTGRPTLCDMRKNMNNRPVMILLVTSLLAFFGHATVFYFMKDLAVQKNLGDVGFFFTTAMVTMIFVRAFGGPAFDLIDKTFTLIAGFLILAVSFFMFTRIEGGLFFYGLAGLYGLGMGVILPQINALIFSFSDPNLKGLNTNLGLFVMDLAYFITPAMSGAMVSETRGYALPFDTGAILALVCLILTVGLRIMGRIRNKTQTDLPDGP